MPVRNLEHYLKQLLEEEKKFDADVVDTIKRKVKGRPGPTKHERKFLGDKFLGEHRHRFDSEATANDLERLLFLKSERKISSLERFILIFKSIPAILELLYESFLGQLGQLLSPGTAKDRYIKRVRAAGRKREPRFRGTASIAKVDPHSGVAEVEEALNKTIKAIDGFHFVSEPPKGKEKNEHTVLIKVGLNWGHFLYPTVTSWESVYALTKMCLNEPTIVKVIIGDESGIENELWGGTTKHNFEQTGILHAAVLAGLEKAASLEEKGEVKFKGAEELLKRARQGHKVTFDEGDTDSVQMIDLALRAGVEIIAFDEKKEYKLIRIPDAGKIKHFTEGALVPRIVDEKVTDIINLPKPPGRHLIMGNTGLSGALKNHIGLLQADERMRRIHGQWHRFPKKNESQSKESYLRSLKDLKEKLATDKSGRAGRKFAHSLGFNWRKRGEGMPFHEAVAEIYLAFADKERFSATDMRWTVSSVGPDLGDTIDIGAMIAAGDPMTLDVLAGAFLKRRYEEIGSSIDALIPGGDSFSEFLAGRTWLRGCNPFDLKSHIAANSYGVGPIDLDDIDLKGFESSGFRVREIDAVASYLHGRRRSRVPRRGKALAKVEAVG